MLKHISFIDLKYPSVFAGRASCASYRVETTHMIDLGYDIDYCTRRILVDLDLRRVSCAMRNHTGHVEVHLTELPF